jgi:hypothetical protein
VSAKILLLLLALPSLAWADGPITVVVRSPGTPALIAATGRVAAELTAAGYRLSTDCAPALHEGCAQEWPAGAPALAAVDFAWATQGLAIEARVARADRRTVRLETLVWGTPAPEPSVVAVRTAELVRAGVLAVMREPAPAAAVVAAPSRPVGAGFFVALGPGLVQSVSGLGSAVGPSLRAGLTWRGSWFAAGWLVAPALAAALDTDQGQAELRTDLFGGELGGRWRLAGLRPSLTAGGGAYHLRVRGKDVAPLIAETRTLWTPFVSAGAGLGLPLSARWAVQADLRAAFVRRSALVRVAETEAGRTGWPLLVAAIALEYGR